MPFSFVNARPRLFSDQPVERVHMSTLILLRWIALAGQSVAVIVALVLGVRFDLWPVLAVVAAGALLNLQLMLRPPHWLARVRVQLVADLLQISALLWLTGGISNPFALLVLAPVIISATALNARFTMALGLATIALVTIFGLFGQPLYDADGIELHVTPLLEVGQWAAVVIAVVFFGLYAYRVATELAAVSDALFATQMALAREQKLQHLGGIVAAAAHEMGTPLATIKLVSSELAEELADILPERNDMAADVQLLQESADRCRDIMRSMGRAGKDDLVVHGGPLDYVVQEAAEPHQGRGPMIEIVLEPAPDADPVVPEIRRDPGVIHGLRNLVQNAVDFGREQVVIRAGWTPDRITLSISDDGPGYPVPLLGRIGDPFLTRKRASVADSRGPYEGMGLGLFIAKTLLERSGATLVFDNQPEGAGGAVVRIDWPRAMIEYHDSRRALGENQVITE